MEYTRDDLNTMTAAQLREFANERGIRLPSNGTKAALIDVITGEAEPENTEEEHQAAVVNKGPDEKIEIMIYADAGPGGQDDVKVGLNGYMRQIKRDRWVKVPRGVLDILDNAQQTILEEAGTDDDGNIQYRERTVRRFTYQVR